MLSGVKRAAFLFVALGLLDAVSAAQEVRIRVLDGRNGRPVRDEINVDFFENDERGIDIGHRHNWRWLTPRTDKDGVIQVRLEPTDKYITVEPAETIDGRLKRKERPDLLHPPLSSVAEIIHSGIVLENHCGEVQAVPGPGELVFFVKPLHWWQKFLGGLFS